MMKSRRLPIHYRIEQLDFVGAEAELRGGADPGKVDERGQTALDLVVELLGLLLRSILRTPLLLGEKGHVRKPKCVRCHSLCSSYESTTARNESCGRQGRRSLSQAQKKSRSEEWNTVVSGCPQNSVPQDKSVVLNSEEKEKATGAGRLVWGRHELQWSRDEAELEDQWWLGNWYTDKNIVLTCRDCNWALGAEKVFLKLEPGEVQCDCIIPPDLVSIWIRTAAGAGGAVKRGTGRRTEAMINEAVRCLRGAGRLAGILASCPRLRTTGVQGACRALRSVISAPPVLYLAAMQTAFTTIPMAPSGYSWEPVDPADSRRLLALILLRRQPGHLLFAFLGALAPFVWLLATLCNCAQMKLNFYNHGHFFCSNKRCLQPFYGYQCCNNSSIGNNNCAITNKGVNCAQAWTAQSWLHMAFVLDCAPLFHLFANQSYTFNHGFFFPWEKLLLTIASNKRKFALYLPILHRICLKARIKKRLIEDEDHDQASSFYTRIELPYEERYLKRDVLILYSNLYGRKEAEKLEKNLRHWKFAANRMED